MSSESESPGSLEQKKALVKRLIEEAFVDVPYPGDDDLCEPWGVSEELDTIEGFRGRHWKQMPEEISIPLLSNSLIHMTPRAFHFFLPGYIIAMVGQPGCESGQATLCWLTPPELGPDFSETDRFRPRMYESPYYEESKADFEERMRLLTSRQKNAVLAFLSFLKEENLYEGEELDRALTYFTRETQAEGSQGST